jgi:DNA repair exonuclease SbcCD nuclease subunit
LVGLSQKSRDVAERIDDASRRAFNNLISLATEEECAFVLIAGDVFDGNWRDYRTGLFFVDGMRRLKSANIPAFIVLGNHDAENRFASRLKFAENVHLFSPKKAETRRIDKLAVAVHGRSYPQRDVMENLASTYPPPVEGFFNIGLLHSACSGRAGYEPYAPCTVEQLVNHGYDYWALGHIHDYDILKKNPHIVYSGNLQGRQLRESGAKGAVLVTVEEGVITDINHHALDIVRWDVADVDVSGATDLHTIEDLTRARLRKCIDAAEGRAVAARVRLFGETNLYGELLKGRSALAEEMQTIAADISPDLWIERLQLDTTQAACAPVVDPTVSGKIKEVMRDLSIDAHSAQRLEALLTDVKSKMPAAARVDELINRLRKEVPRRALELAISVVDGPETSTR